MTEDQDWLRSMMRRYDLDIQQVSRLAECSYSLVQAWLAPSTTPRYRELRPVYRGMLEARLAKKLPVIESVLD